MFGRRFETHRTALTVALTVLTAVISGSNVHAQSLSTSDGVGSSLSQIIAANAGNAKQICPAIAPLLHATPSSATVVIESAQARPDLLEPLCECLSQAQKQLKSTDPEGAAIVAKAVAAASPVFQACYAVALAPGEGGGAQAAAGAPQDTGGGGVPYSPGGLGFSAGIGGGPVSPN
jgi:hypothetical protein